MPAATRDRILEAGARLLWRQGYNGTGVKQIVQEAGAPFASLYHFFPGGKEQLAVEAVRWSGRHYAAVVAGVLVGEDDVVEAVRRGFADAGRTLVTTGYEDACPIATVALETSNTSDPIRLACAEVFDSWIDGLAAWFGSHGAAAADARRLSLTFLMLLEGGFIFSRAGRTTEPLDVAGETMAELTRAATPPRH